MVRSISNYLRVWLFLAGAPVLLAQPACAAWLEASTDHFIIYSDTDEPRLREFASHLERFDKGLRQIFIPTAPEDEGRRSNRVRIYVVANVTAVEKLCGRQCRNIYGFYLPRMGGSVAFTPRRSGYKSQHDLDAETVLFHEYAHHFMYTNFSAAYPTWFSEGFAELASTAQFQKDGKLGFGLPAYHRAYGLFRGTKLTLEQLLGSEVRLSGDPEAIEALYGRGWLLTHYLFFNPDRRGQLSAYIEAINEGTPSVAAGKTAFGDLKSLDRELDKYLTGRFMKYLALPADRLAMGPVEIRPMSPGAAAMMPIHLRSTRGVTRATALKILPEARRLAAPYPQDPEAQSQLAEAEYDAGHPIEAQAAADRALEADPKNMRALLHKGRVLIDRAVAEGATDKKIWYAARSWYVKANAADPNAALPLALFYASFTAAGVTPTANAVEGLNRAFDLSPEDRGLRLQVARQALIDNHPKLARSALAPIAFDPHASALRDMAGGAIDFIDAGKPDEALKALSVPLKDEEDEGDDQHDAPTLPPLSWGEGVRGRVPQFPHNQRSSASCGMRR